ncbi:MAG: SUMF1/EgtB/PvdO family nonheme iron enzyme, partial [Myxococcales bacterium]|nr:SUMF1/EgtB/PvdO family nonheme iron enzyme [Myxococcales bacterium]
MRSSELILGTAALAMGLSACGGDDGGGGSEPVADMGAVAESFTCNTATRRAESDQPAPAGGYACAGEPAFVTLTTARGRTYDIFAYEASHPLASADDAFPCAHFQPEDGSTLVGVMQAPDVDAQACSQAGVRPWHSVKWDTAKASCEAIGWRLCTKDELLRSCQGPDSTAYAFGRQFEGGKCNFREAYTGPNAEDPSEAPAGQYAECTAGEGVFDANGNLWEWSSERDANDNRARYYHGAGWKTIAQRHQDEAQVCDVESR